MKRVKQRAGLEECHVKCTVLNKMAGEGFWGGYIERSNKRKESCRYRGKASLEKTEGELRLRTHYRGCRAGTRWAWEQPWWAQSWLSRVRQECNRKCSFEHCCDLVSIFQRVVYGNSGESKQQEWNEGTILDEDRAFKVALFLTYERRAKNYYIVFFFFLPEHLVV